MDWIPDEHLVECKVLEEQTSNRFVAGPDDGNAQQQRELPESITEACIGSGVDVTWAFDGSRIAHYRDFVTNSGWKIVLDRGPDVFQSPMRCGGFSLGDRLQEHLIPKTFHMA